MPRKNPIPEIELSACRRLMEFRKQELWLTRVALAAQLGMDSARLANYELARVPLKFDLADHFCKTFNVSMRWLAEGVGNRRGYRPIHPELRSRIPHNAPFATFWRDHLSGYIIESSVDEILELCRALKTSGSLTHPDEAARLCFWELSEHIEKVFYRCDTSLKLRLIRSLYVTLANFACENLGDSMDYDWSDLQEEATTWVSLPKEEPQRTVDTLTEHSNIEGVSEMESLIRRLRAAVAKRGARAALARHLGVALPRISEWLREQNPQRPSGETALKLAKWVAQQEEAARKKTNTPGSGANTVEGEATKCNANENKSKPSGRAQE